MKEKFAHYNLELAGGADRHADRRRRATARSSTILTQLRARQIAEEQVETYDRQQERAPVKERELREAEARARQQQALTESEIVDHDPGEPGQGRRTPAPSSRPRRSGPWRRPRPRRSASSPRARRKRDPPRRRGRGRPGRPRRHRPGDGDRGAGPRLRRPAVPAHPAGDEPLRRGHREVRRRRRAEGRHRRPRGRRRREWRGDVRHRMGGGTILESLLALLLSERVGVDVAGTTAPSAAAAVVRDELQRRLGGGDAGKAA